MDPDDPLEERKFHRARQTENKRRQKESPASAAKVEEELRSR